MKWETSSQSGNMQALEKVYKKYQILISDGFGGLLEQGKDWVMRVYTQDEYGEYKCNPTKNAGEVKDSILNQQILKP